MKPDWKRGDVIAMPQDLQPKYGSDGGIYHGCCVFVAEHDPRCTPSGEWFYGNRPCSQLRRSTPADIERLIRIQIDTISREARILGELQGMLDQITQDL